MQEYLIVLARAAIAYIVLAVLTRMMGKRELSQLTIRDYVVGITIGSITANMSFKTDEPVFLFLPAIVLFSGIEIILSRISLKSPRLRNFSDGTTTILIREGRILKENLKKERLSIDELLMMLRDRDVFNVADVDYALLERNGKMSILRKAERQWPVLSDLNIKKQASSIPVTIIKDGKLAQEEIEKNKLDINWVFKKLNESDIQDISTVFFAQADNTGIIYIELYNGQ
ncbi:MAG TPA: DUF421 domain-containing protein [Ignavibacteriales bacterium]|nr:DUF421 domain-containing protein [Ignavibacteriales bacterium]